MIWLSIFAMAAIVFASRYLFLEPKIPLRLSKTALQFLSYSAPAVLTSIFAPIVFIREEELSIGLDNPYLLCAILATILAVSTRNALITTVISMAVFFVIN
ncbi:MULTISPECIES: AzlD domain-containing protein [unclassified Agarivorans]|uniref:AzlD domain-containing protein n=1 Tax=unclassified Agarivorans TaxID=2636026 RepID=UPI0010E6FA8C|nr:MULTISPECIES: AzlD domain-containing protein [unclassified Agarivorans]MDO6687247.1 AzlD domain-containing protein [Agarivorans sp. 3_MG-2023]MDO6716826.1 AzlD domain-containing protein [Agarivorans sp. 2_MG-2023]MDO6765985.1 AzlD domain-containing protein [Agarivorans sp. 1_MG-2023]GDY25532.1 branched-chain amino acid ABC transporter [Agarivorans sp. Toyoura001]